MLSIIVPVFNEALYLSRCLDSICSQSFSDWELILVDDGSMDGSSLICDEYAARDSRIRVVHQDNEGPSKARNVGLSLCKGDKVAFIDSDDLIHVHYLERLIALMDEQKADVVQTSYVLLKEEDWEKYMPEKLQQSLPATPKIKVFSGHDAISSMLYQREMDSSPIKIYRREVLLYNTFPEQFIAYEDLRALIDVYARCKKTCWVDLPIYYYFKRSSGTLNTWSVRDVRALDVMKSVQSWIEDYDKSLLPAVHSRELSLAFNILRLLSKRDPISSSDGQHQLLKVRCWQIIKEYRARALFNPQMRMKNRLGILLSYFGQNSLIKIFSFFV